jgi:hypothetical protein
MRRKIAEIRLPFTEVYVTVSRHNPLVKRADIPYTDMGSLPQSQGVPVKEVMHHEHKPVFIGQINKGRLHNYTRGLNYWRSGKRASTNAFAVGGLILETLRRHGIGYTFKDDLIDMRLVERTKVCLRKAGVIEQLKVNKKDWADKGRHSTANKRQHIDNQIAIIDKAIREHGDIDNLRLAHLNGGRCLARTSKKAKVNNALTPEQEDKRRLIEHYYMCSQEIAERTVRAGLDLPLPQDYIVQHSDQFAEYLEWSTK